MAVNCTVSGIRPGAAPDVQGENVAGVVWSETETEAGVVVTELPGIPALMAQPALPAGDAGEVKLAM